MKSPFKAMLLTAGLMLATTPPVLAQTAPAVAAATQSVVASVKGLVCDFCARSIEKVFGKQTAVDSVKVDLDASEIRIRFKPGQSMSDDQIARLIRDSGYSLTAITRSEH